VTWSELWSDGPLRQRHLRVLARDAVAAIRIKRFLRRRQCDHLAARIFERDDRTGHSTVPGLQLAGIPFYLASRDAETMSNYYRGVEAIPELLREISAPFDSPLDRVCHALAAAWRAGVVREELEPGRSMAPAVLRLYPEGVGIAAHHDVLAEEVPGSSRAHSLTAQFGLNLFLAVSGGGGTLEIYRRQYSTAAYRALTIPGTEDLDRAVLGPPDCCIQPEVGDLILNLSWNVHAVTPVTGRRPRLTLSAFVGMRTPCEPLTLWA
jgi:hypothetical protein